jgi:hypothetical protein
MQQGFSAMDERFHRLEFLQQCQRQLARADFVVTWNRPLTTEELGHYRVLAEIKDPYSWDQSPTLSIGGRNGFMNAKSTDGSRAVGQRTIVWCRDPDETLEDHLSLGKWRTKQLKVGIHGRFPFPTLSNWERKWVFMWVTKPLVPLIESIYLIVNDYALAGGPREQLHVDEARKPPSWIKALTDEEAKIRWVSVLRQVAPGAPEGSDWYIDFSQSTPPKKQTMKIRSR